MAYEVLYGPKNLARRLRPPSESTNDQKQREICTREVTAKRLSLLSEAAALVSQPFTPSDTLRAVIPVTHGRYETRFRGRSL